MTGAGGPPSPLILAQQQLLTPMLPVIADEPFDSPEHIFELKWGGVRALAFIESQSLTLIGANGRDITHWYPELQDLPRQVRSTSAVLDGEIVALGKEGYPDFDLLRERFKAHGMAPPQQLPQTGTLSYQVYDVLLAGGRPLIESPLWRRKDALHGLLRLSEFAQATDFIDGEGIAFYEAAVEHKLEGIVAKRKDSEYYSGERSPEWQELRIQESIDVVIGGYTFGGSSPGARGGRRTRLREPFSSLLLGIYNRDGGFQYLGQVSGPFTLGEAGLILEFLTEQHTATSPFSEDPVLQKFIHWCRPELVCRVRFSSWTRDGMLRFPIFVALRPDLLPTDCIVEHEPVAPWR
ncbi:MAG: hypothetical protein GEU28_10145 [Dehalococcoidia bacterium]|nr:hypothetical protein [Dehalococcoidia bacterium]